MCVFSEIFIFDIFPEKDIFSKQLDFSSTPDTQLVLAAGKGGGGDGGGGGV